MRFFPLMKLTTVCELESVDFHPSWRRCGGMIILLLILCGGLGLDLAAEKKKYEPNWESIRQHHVPEWYEDAKLGIFIHWGLYSVPGWAPPTGELGKVDMT